MAVGRNYIARRAQRLGYDPEAVLAVAGQEGLSGAVGDQGTSFGPFQLHWGGAMPGRFRGNRQASQAWAWSPAGIDYALGQMGGARGLRGRAAISAIVRGFERPADPAGEIARASASYGGRGGQVPAGGGFTVRPAGIPSFPRAAFTNLPDIAGKIGEMPFLGGGFKTMPMPFIAPPPNFVDFARAANGGLQHPPGAFANQAVRAAATQIGKPYQFGSGPSTQSFDCSDLVQWAYKQMGISLPRTTYQQINVGRPVTGGLKPGDLVFPTRHHVVMYVGNGKVIAAPHTGTVVQYQDLASFGRPVAVRRILN